MEARELIEKFCKEDSHIRSIVVYDMDSEKILETTSPEDTGNVIEVTKVVLNADERANKASKRYVGKTNWYMYSFEKTVIVRVRIVKEIFIQIEYSIETAPSAAIEDGLELALMVGNHLAE